MPCGLPAVLHTCVCVCAENARHEVPPCGVLQVPGWQVRKHRGFVSIVDRPRRPIGASPPPSHSATPPPHHSRPHSIASAEGSAAVDGVDTSYREVYMFVSMLRQVGHHVCHVHAHSAAFCNVGQWCWVQPVARVLHGPHTWRLGCAANIEELRFPAHVCVCVCWSAEK